MTLEKVYNILQSLGIKWWLQGGGLITMYRDNYLKPTLDWDIGIFEEDLSPTVINKVKKHLYIRSFWRAKRDKKISFTAVNHQSHGLDFNYFYKGTKLKKYYYRKNLSPTVIKKVKKHLSFWGAKRDKKISFTAVNPKLFADRPESSNERNKSHLLDIFCFYKDTKLKKYYYSGFPDNSKNLFRCYHTPFDIDYYNYKGFDIPIPSNTELFLEETYGEEWRVPNSSQLYIYEYACAVETPYKIIKDYSNNFIGVSSILNRRIK